MLQFLRELVFHVVELGRGEGGEVDCLLLSAGKRVGCGGGVYLEEHVGECGGGVLV